MVGTNETVENVGFEKALNMLLTKGLIHKDLKGLTEVLESIQRTDLVEAIKAYQTVFSRMEDEEFISKFKKEISTQAKEM